MFVMPYVRVDGQRVRELRLRNVLSQEELKRRCGVGRATIRRLEAGELVTLSTARRVFRALKVARPGEYIVEVVEDERGQGRDATGEDRRPAPAGR